MSSHENSGQRRFLRFRTELLIAMMLVIAAVTALSLYIAQRNVAADFERDLQRDFQSALASLHQVQAVRHGVLAERCRALVRKPRLHAALEDNALDLLYPSAKDELRDVMKDDDEAPQEASMHALRAEFYRFLDANGAVISPQNADAVGDLSPEEERRLALPRVPAAQQIGYLARSADASETTVNEVIAMPIISTETGEVISALVVGFKPVDLGAQRAAGDIKSGIWLHGRLHLESVAPSVRAELERNVSRVLARGDSSEHSVPVDVAGAPHLLFYKRLNERSLFAAAYEICLYPMEESLARQRQLRWRIVGAGALLLLGGLAASHVVSARLSMPVEKLAVDSEENRLQRARAEAALEATSRELQRSARFSSDASHQLKTPVAVLRAGLEELLARDEVTPGMQEEISALIHQTYRLNNVVEDLLLLSRMDAGRLQLEFSPVNLSQLIEAWLDDLSALPDALELKVTTDFPSDLHIAGEKRYTSLILQNLLENARKYNRPGGRIEVSAHDEEGWVFLHVRNTAQPIHPAAQEHIFERFHRGSAGENVPGHGLGLNLARELARIHGGDVRLVRSDAVWTEFEVRFRLAEPISPTYVSA